jgi:selenocysteine lyase/cysteine desulfurase
MRRPGQVLYFFALDILHKAPEKPDSHTPSLKRKGQLPMSSAPDRPLFDPADFRIPDKLTHVCAAGETPFLRRHDEAFARYIHDKGQGARGREAQEATVERAREQLAALWHVQPAEIGWVSNVAEGVSLVLDSLQLKQGDNVCVMANEFPSVVAPLLARPRPDYEARLISPSNAARLAAAVDENTRAVLISYVSYLNGERFDLQLLRQAADAVGALLIVDFTQASGYLPIMASIADFAFSASYKWMLGMTGTAAAYWNRERIPDWQPISAGWHSLADDATQYDQGIKLRSDAMRFTRGNPAHASIYILSSALDYLADFDPAKIQAHVHGLTTDLLARLAKHGIETSTPADPARHGASICLPAPDAHELHARMDQADVLAWNGHGRLRISFHGYNCSADVDRVESALLDALARRYPDQR